MCITAAQTGYTYFFDIHRDVRQVLQGSRYDMAFKRSSRPARSEQTKIKGASQRSWNASTMPVCTRIQSAQLWYSISCATQATDIYTSVQAS